MSGEVSWCLWMDQAIFDEGAKGVAIGIAAGKFDIWAFVEEGSFLDLLIDPFFDDRVLEFLERTDEGSICAGNCIEGRYRVKTGICHRT